MKRKVKSLEPFAFQSDFTPAQPPQVDTGKTVHLTPEELSHLLAEARAQAVDVALQTSLDAQRAHLTSLSNKMIDALGVILRLGEHLEHAALDEYDRQQALKHIKALASTLLDGQGELDLNLSVLHRP